jgi:hypothetical protein
VIDFRYHLVSIIAIFFALAAGIVLGAGPLGDQADENLGDQLAEFRQQNDELRQERDAVQAELDRQNEFIDEMAPRSVNGELSGRHIAMIALPGSEPDDVDAVQEILTQAGAITDLRVRIEPAWTDPDSEDLLDDLAATYVSSGTALDETSDSYARGATVLASSIMAQVDVTEIGPPSLEPLNTDTLAAYESGGLITLEEESPSRATLAVFVAGGISGDDAGDRVQHLVSVAHAVDVAGEGVVVAGPASIAEDGGVLALIRDTEVSDDVSTVDTVNSPGGRVGVVFAMVQQVAGASGQYGQVGAADGLVPPAPEAFEPGDDPTDEPTNESTEDSDSGDEPGSGDDGTANDDDSSSEDGDITEVGSDDSEGE